MSIKDKNGNIYKLRGPNPIMKNQEKWDDSKLIFHNMQFSAIVIKDEKNSSLFIDEPKIGKEIVIENNNVVIENNNVSKPPVPQEYSESNSKPKIQVQDRIAKLLDEKKVIFHCLPVTIHRFEDSFYQETSTRISYGKKFDFPGVVIKWDDLGLQFWTDREIPNQSIIFPTNLEMKRWWKIQKSEEKSGGHMMFALPSDISPDFS